MEYDFGNSRSEFWVRIYQNDDGSCVFITNKHTLNIVNYFFSYLENISPKGWTITNNNNYSLWIPPNNLNDNDIQAFNQWANNCNTHIWLKTNKNIEKQFMDELNYCVASDWNFSFETNTRTNVGEAEYKLKYHYPKGKINAKEAANYSDILANAIMDCFQYLPIENTTSILVTSIPSNRENLSWGMAKYVCNKLNVSLLSSNLKVEKQQTKGLSIDQKIEMWDSIYKCGQVDLTETVYGKTVLIVDDLYQSGTSIWSFAKHLKSMGTSLVYGLVAVKSQRDSDNQ